MESTVSVYSKKSTIVKWDDCEVVDALERRCFVSKLRKDPKNKACAWPKSHSKLRKLPENSFIKIS